MMPTYVYAQKGNAFLGLLVFVPLAGFLGFLAVGSFRLGGTLGTLGGCSLALITIGLGWAALSELGTLGTTQAALVFSEQSVLIPGSNASIHYDEISDMELWCHTGQFHTSPYGSQRLTTPLSFVIYRKTADPVEFPAKDLDIEEVIAQFERRVNCPFRREYRESFLECVDPGRLRKWSQTNVHPSSN